MKKSFALFFGFFCVVTISYGQDAQKFGIKFTGFVKSDIYYDSRQSVSIRDGHFLLYPKNENLDPNNNDINAKSDFNIISIQTRLRGNITGPDAFGAKTSGAIEGEFFGHASGEINEFRLRHAYVKLDWTKTSVLVGQYWHPMFITKCFPGTVSFNTGVPFLPFSRNPQIRISQKLGNFKGIFTAHTQRDFVSSGPDGANTKYLRNSVLPALNLRFEYEAAYDNGHELLFGISANYKSLVPRLDTDSNYVAENKASSMALMAYLKYKIPFMTMKLAAFRGQDAYNLTMLGGYAEEKIADPVTGDFDYVPFCTMSVWGDFHTNGKVWQVGLFLGVTENLGAAESIFIDKEKNPGSPEGGIIGSSHVYARGADIEYVYRIAPRFIYNTGKFRIAPEVEYTVAAYATKDSKGNYNIDSKGRVTDSKEVGLVRFLLGVYYFF